MIATREEMERKIYDFVNNYIEEQKVNPSIREIAAAVGYKNVSGVFPYIKRMEQNGKLFVNGRRGISTVQQRSQVVSVPIVGSIACGVPMFAEENVEDYIPILRNKLGRGVFFALHAHGDSMVDVGIDDGDLVFVRKQETAEDGDIVVALVEDEATLKRYYRDEKNNKIILRPANKKYEDMIFKDVIIQGIAVKVLKDL